MKTDKLYYGVSYYDEYMPVSRVEEDMRLMKQAGFNLIRIAESTWSTWEPREGEFDFSSLHRMLSGAQKHGISVIVGTPTYAIPPWMAKKYPDVLTETHEGRPYYGHRQLMDLTHPGFRHHCKIIIEKLLEQCRDYDCIIGYQLDNECKPYDNCSERAQAGFRAWLKERFGTVENLNKAFGLAYWSNSIGDWDDLPDVRGTVNGSYGAAYMAYQRQIVNEFLAWEKALVEPFVKPGQFLMHNFDYDWRFYSFGFQPDVDQFGAAKLVDVAGMDIYHLAGSENTGAELSFGGDVGRGLKGENHFVIETQCQGHMGRLPYPGQLRLQAFHHLAGGANCVAYWNWHSIHNGKESYWKGVLSHDLLPGRAYRECADVGADFARLGDHLKNLTKHNRVAMVLSHRSLDGFRWHPVSGWRELPCRGYNDYLRWVYDAFYRQNIEVDLVNDTCRDFSGYDLVVLPGLYSAEEGLATAIRNYVAGGGHILATMRSFFADENMQIRPAAQPYGLTDVFGMTYDEITVPQGMTLDRLPGPVEDWMELLRPTTARVRASYVGTGFGGTAAVTENDFGQGWAVYVGCYAPEAMEPLAAELASRLGLHTTGNVWPVVEKTGINALGRQVTYLLNYSAQPMTAKAPAGRELLTNTILSETVTLEPWGAAIVEAETEETP